MKLFLIMDFCLEWCNIVQTLLSHSLKDVSTCNKKNIGSNKIEDLSCHTLRMSTQLQVCHLCMKLIRCTVCAYRKEVYDVWLIKTPRRPPSVIFTSIQVLTAAAVLHATGKISVYFALFTAFFFCVAKCWWRGISASIAVGTEAHWTWRNKHTEN